ncbi:MAG: PaaI family thioesterase [Haliea sp.]|nr:PaaI family thioesterase [Haliea sp.]
MIPNHMQQLYDLFSSRVGAHHDQGLELRQINGNVVKLLLPFRPKHANSTENGALHTTALATAIDSACGFAVMLSLTEPSAIATVNLRIDHIHQPEPGQDMTVEAHCYQQSGDFAYVRAAVLSLDTLITYCHAIGIFKVGTPGPALNSAF